MNTGVRKNTGSNKNHDMVTTISDKANVFKNLGESFRLGVFTMALSN